MIDTYRTGLRTCKHLEAALAQAVKGGQEVGVASVEAAAQARARRVVAAAPHHCRHVPARPAEALACYSEQKGKANFHTLVVHT